MYEFLVGCQAEAVETLLEEIFHRFDVMVGDGLDLLDAFGVLERKIAADVAELVENRVVNVLELGQREFTQSYEIFHLDPYTVTDQGEFRKIVVK